MNGFAYRFSNMLCGIISIVGHSIRIAVQTLVLLTMLAVLTAVAIPVSIAILVASVPVILFEMLGILNERGIGYAEKLRRIGSMVRISLW